MSLDLVEELAQDLGQWRGELERLALAGMPGSAIELGSIVARVTELERRVQRGGHASLRVAFFGPTGAGKSKLVSSVCGANVTRSGFHRPFTRRPLLVVHRDDRDSVAVSDADVCVEEHHAWRGLILVDTPDFDSVEIANREAAEQVQLESDAFVVVVDVQKYADAAFWAYLERIARSGKEWCVVFNKARGDDALADFVARLDRVPAAPKAAVLEIPELAIDDVALIPRECPALVSLRRWLDVLADSRESLHHRLRSVFLLQCARCSEDAAALCTRVAGRLTGFRAAAEIIKERHVRARKELESALETVVDPGLKGIVYERALERLTRLDILRFPRRLLALPFEGLRRLLRSGATEPVRVDSAAESTGSESLHIVTRAILDVEVDLERVLVDLGVALAASRVGLAHEDVQAIHSERFAEFRAWLRRQADETSTRLTTQTKLKFFLSQALVNSLLIGLQLHSGGALSLAEIAADGVLSPFLAKAVGMAVSSEEVRAFETSAHQEHARMLTDIVARNERCCLTSVEGGLGWLGRCESVLGEISLLRAREPKVAAALYGESAGVEPDLRLATWAKDGS